MAKISNQLSTEISLDTIKAATSLKSLQSAITATANTWKNLSAAQKSVGDDFASLKTKSDGLTQTMKLQEQRIAELQQKQKELTNGLGITADTTEKVKQKYQSYQNQINRLTAQMANEKKQLEQTNQQLKYHESGLASLQSTLKQSQAVTKSTVERLKEEGNQYQANAEKIKGLRNTYDNLNRQYKIQEQELAEIAAQSGKASDAYQKQAVRLNETATKMEKAKNEQKELNSSFLASNTAVAKVKDGYTKLDNGVSKVGTSVKNTASKLAAGATVAAGAIATTGAAFVTASESAQKLQTSYKTTSNLLVTGGEKQAEVTANVAKMQKDGETISLKYGKSQQEIADAYQDLVKRGDTSKQALGSMNEIVQASIASGDDLKDVTQVTSNVMESFGLKVDASGKKLESVKEITKRTSDTVNSLAYAADMTSTNFSDMGVAMSYVGASAKNAGQSVSETASAVGVLSNNGLEADKAGTGLRKVLNSIIQTAQGINDKSNILNNLGIKASDIMDSKGNLKDLATVMGVINSKTKDMSTTQKGAIFNSLFGTTGQQAGIILAENADQMKKLNEQVEKAGKNNYVGTLANKNMQTAQNAMKQFKMVAADVANTLATNMLPTVSKLAETFANFANTSGFKGIVKDLGSGISAVGSKMQEMFTYISKNQKAFNLLGSSILKIIGELGSGAWSVFKGVISEISTVINVLTGNANKSKSSIDGIANAFKVLASHKRTVETIGAAFATYFAASKFIKISKSIGEVGSAFKDLMATLAANPFLAIAAAIAGVAAALIALYNKSAWFRDKVNAVFNAIKITFKTVGETFGDIGKTIGGVFNGISSGASHCADWVSSHFDGMVKAVQSATAKAKGFVKERWNDMKNAVSDAVTAITDKNSKLHDDMISKISDAMGVSKQTLNDGYNTMSDYTTTFKDLVTGKWGKLGDDVKKTATDLSSTAKDVFSGMYDKLNDLTGGGLDKIKNAWSKMWTNIVEGINNAVKNVGHAVSRVVNNVIEPVNKMLDGVKSGVNWVLDKFGASKWSGFRIPEVHLATGGTVGKGGTMALVNDAPGKNYREMFATPDGKIGAFPKDRNVHTFLPEGTQVLDGERSRQLADMLEIPHFKDGTKDKDFFGNIFDKAFDLFDKIKDVISHPFEFLEQALTKNLHISTNVKFAADMIAKAPSFFAKQGINWLKKMAEDWKKKQEESVGGFGNIKDMKNSAELRDLVKAALEANGLSTDDSMIARVMRQIATESGGNAHAVQPGADPDGDGSGPAMGLMQTKRGTFNAYKAPGHDDIFNAYDNLLAALNYAKHTYGPSLSFLGNGHGYANGGFINHQQIAMIGEQNKPEVVIPLSKEKQGRALDLLTGTVNKLNRNAGRKTQVTTQGTNSSIERKLDTMISLLGSILGVNQQQLNSGNGFDLNGLYKKMYKDQQLNNYQTF